MTPLTALIDKKKGPVKWNKEAEEAFVRIKEICGPSSIMNNHDAGEASVSDTVNGEHTYQCRPPSCHA